MITALKKIYQFSGQWKSTIKKSVLFSLLHSIFDMFQIVRAFSFDLRRFQRKIRCGKSEKSEIQFRCGEEKAKRKGSNRRRSQKRILTTKIKRRVLFPAFFCISAIT